MLSRLNFLPGTSQFARPLVFILRVIVFILACIYYCVILNFRAGGGGGGGGQPKPPADPSVVSDFHFFLQTTCLQRSAI